MYSTNQKMPSIIALLMIVILVLVACSDRSAKSYATPPGTSAQQYSAKASDDPNIGGPEPTKGTPVDARPAVAKSEHLGEKEQDVTMAPREDMAAAHGIPRYAVAVENPVVADKASVARGAELFQANCTVCHGPSGVGDGPAPAGLDPKPANLTAAHGQENTDGSLFYTISEGAAGTAMPS